MSSADVRGPAGIVSLSLDGEALRVPDSWANYRHQKRGRDDGSRWYAVLTRTATREACGTVDGSGLDLPDRHEFGLLVLYAREDGRRAFERWYPSELDSERRPRPDGERFFSSLVLPADYDSSSEVDPETRPTFRELLQETHGVEPTEEVSR